MATAVIPRTESYSSSRSSYDTDSDRDDSRGGLKSSVSIVSQRPPSKRERSYDGNRKQESDKEWVERVEPEPKKKKDEEQLTTKTGGAYIPPARLRMMQEQIQDKSSAAYQRMAWEALKKSINGFINKINVSNIKQIIRELFQENIIRGRGLLARSTITAQSASPTFSHVYAALVAVVNTKFPQTGELIAKRLIIQFQKGFRRNNKTLCLSSVRFIAHLINQQVLHELLALEILTLLLEDPTNDSVEVAIGFLKECGMKLTELTPSGIHGVFESLKGILHDGNIDVRVQYMIEVMYAVRKDGFKEHPAVLEGLNLVDEDDQITHLLSLEDELDGEDILNIFKMDPDYLENEEKYKSIREDILGSDDSDEDGDSEEDSDDEEDNEGAGQGAGQVENGDLKIIDETQTNLLELRRTIYLTIMSSLDFEECAHKVMKMAIKPGQEMEVSNMIIECCSQERSYQRFYGLLGERFCHLNEMWVGMFDAAFQEQYSTVHRLETNKLRNVAKFFAQLFYTDALPWTSLTCIHLNEEDTNSSSRIFVKILFQELAEYMGLPKLNDRLKDPFLAESFEGLLPRDNPRNTRFSINFFTSIGLGGLTDDLREHLKNAPKRIMEQEQDVDSDSSSSDEDSDTDSDSETGSDSDSDSDTDSSSESESEDSVIVEKEQRRRATDNRSDDRKKVNHEKKRTSIRDGPPRKDRDDDRQRRRRRSTPDSEGSRKIAKEGRREEPRERRHRKRDGDKVEPEGRSRKDRRGGSPREEKQRRTGERGGSPIQEKYQRESRKGGEERDRSPHERRQRSPSPPRRQRSPLPPHRQRSPLPPRRQRSPSSPSPPRRRRSPSPHRRQQSPSLHRRQRSPSSPSPPRRRRSPSPHRRRRSPSPPRRQRSPSSPSPPCRRRSSSPPRHRRSRSPPRHRSRRNHSKERY